MKEETKCCLLAVAFVIVIFGIVIFGGPEVATTSNGKAILDAICF